LGGEGSINSWGVVALVLRQFGDGARRSQQWCDRVRAVALHGSRSPAQGAERRHDGCRVAGRGRAAEVPPAPRLLLLRSRRAVIGRSPDPDFAGRFGFRGQHRLVMRPMQQLEGGDRPATLVRWAG